MKTPNPDDDGVTHVNVYSGGRTSLGRWLSNFTISPIETEDGPFKSIEGYWYWLGSGDDRLRGLAGYPAKKLGRQVRPKNWEETPEFRDKVRRAVALKLASEPNMHRQLRELEVPLEHYYVFKGHVVVPTDGRWLIEYMDAMRGEES